MAASRLQELAAMRNLTTCELDKRRHLVTDVRTSKRHMASSTCLATRCRSYLTHIPYIPKSFGSNLFCVNIRALLSASIACCQIRMTSHSSCQIRTVGMLIGPVINQWFTMLLSTTVIFDISQMPICLCPHIPYIPKSFGSHLFCVNIRALLSASIMGCQIRMTSH